MIYVASIVETPGL